MFVYAVVFVFVVVAVVFTSVQMWCLFYCMFDKKNIFREEPNGMNKMKWNGQARLESPSEKFVQIRLFDKDDIHQYDELKSMTKSDLHIVQWLWAEHVCVWHTEILARRKLDEILRTSAFTQMNFQRN